jgi:phage shock protein C
MEATRKLYRSRTDRKLAGVCGGLAEYFGRTDTTIVRVAFVVLALLGGAGIPIYLAMWLIVPVQKQAVPA